MNNMELLFFWVEKTEIFENQGFVFTPAYDFSMAIKSENNVWQLSASDTRMPNIMAQSNIVNVTAVVGENGAGKTSLFRYLLEFRGGFSVSEGECAKSKILCVYQEINDFIVLTNIEKEKLFCSFSGEKNTRFLIYSSSDKATFLFERPCDKITKLYISNSRFLYPNVSGSYRQSLDHLILTPDYLASMADIIFSSINRSEDSVDTQQKNFYIVSAK